MDNYKFFNHKDCEFFPCHPTKDPDNFNCLFCYCPLYRMKDCGGGYVIRNGVKDCSFCLLPHNGAEGYAYVLAKLREINAFEKED